MVFHSSFFGFAESKWQGVLQKVELAVLFLLLTTLPSSSGNI
jgi:hypothetical protein